MTGDKKQYEKLLSEFMDAEILCTGSDAFFVSMKKRVERLESKAGMRANRNPKKIPRKRKLIKYALYIMLYDCVKNRSSLLDSGLEEKNTEILKYEEEHGLHLTDLFDAEEKK